MSVDAEEASAEIQGSEHDYVIVDELGRGGQAVTYLARDGAGTEVALKRLSLRGADSWKAVELFEREAAVLRNLSHEAIPAYVDSFVIEVNGGRAFYLAQELVAGTTLQSKWDDHALEPVLTERQTLRMIREIGAILVYLHELNPPVVHRDIKPANIFRRPDGSFALVDFGAVQALVPGTMGGSTFVGTSGYMAPEQLMGRASPASDIFSLGATAVHMLSGFHPGDLPVRRMKIDFDGVLTARAEVAELLSAMIEPDVHERIATAEDLVRQVSRIESEPDGQLELVRWDGVLQWPMVTESANLAELRFPIAMTNSAASVGLIIGAMSPLALFPYFDGAIMTATIALIVGLCVAVISTFFGFSAATLRLDPERFELRRRRLFAPDHVFRGRLGSLEATASQVAVRSGMIGGAATAQPVLVLESGVDEEILATKGKFDADEVARFIDAFRRSHDR